MKDTLDYRLVKFGEWQSGGNHGIWNVDIFARQHSPASR